MQHAPRLQYCTEAGLHAFAINLAILFKQGGQFL